MDGYNLSECHVLRADLVLRRYGKVLQRSGTFLERMPWSDRARLIQR